ncbi:MAG TPA: autotransporter-associated beta strand repeat-containing protein, partial [Tepidisphaeraceae bacterium]|nr:autotransporter-associated beta strand repeat-containing protein [Tepidisphaeraceae bacterium]
MQGQQASARNRRSIKSHARLIAALTAAVCCGRSASRVAADTWTWTGSASENWNNASNWDHTSGTNASGIPVNSANTIVDFAGSTDTSPNQNIASPLEINSLGFNSGASVFTLGGFGLIFATSSTSVAPTIVQSSSSGEFIEQTLTFANNTTFSGSGTGTVEITAPINGAGSLIDNAAAPLALTASNSYSGGTTINGGQILFNNANAFGGGTIAFNSGTLTATTSTSLANEFSNSTGSVINFQASAGATLTVNPSSALFGSLNFGSSTATGTVNFEPSSYDTFGGQINVNGGELLDGAGSLASVSGIYSVAIAQSAEFNTNGNSESIVDLTGAGTLALGTNSSATFTLETASFSGTITGSGKLVVAGGTAIFSGANTYSGGTTLNSGSIGAGNSSALGSAAVAVAGNVDLYATGASVSLSNPVSLASGKTLTTINAPSGAQSLSLTGNISGSGSLVMSGSDILTLDGTNSYSGGTTINGGQILFNNANAFGGGTIAFNSGTLTATTTTSLANEFSNSTGSVINFQASAGATLTVKPSSALFGSLNFGSSTATGTVNFQPSTYDTFGGQINVNGGELLDGAGSLGSV